MKALQELIDHLTAAEVKAFRLFLASNKKEMVGKKLLLFDALLNNKKFFAKGNYSGIFGKNYSRQAFYQLKKRLQDDLIMFLLFMKQEHNEEGILTVELNCHKKLCCFIVFIDKKLMAEAQSLLSEVISQTLKNQLPHIYMEAVSLYERYFPLSGRKSPNKDATKNQFKLLQDEIDYHHYFSKYQKESNENIHNSDVEFRRNLLEDRFSFISGGNRQVLDGFFRINQLFYKRDFFEAYNALNIFLDWVENKEELRINFQLKGLVYIEITKACICFGHDQEGSKWISKAEAALIGYDYWKILIYELKFYLAMRTSDFTAQYAILDAASKIEIISGKEQFEFKRQVFSIFSHFQQNSFHEVIKGVNAKSLLHFKNHHWYIIIKILELVSIAKLNDFDWLQFKVEAFYKKYKLVNGDESRMQQLVQMLKDVCCSGKLDENETADQVGFIENNLPWHPLSSEIIDINQVIGSLALSADFSHH